MGAGLEATVDIIEGPLSRDGETAEAPSEPGRAADKEDAAEVPTLLTWDGVTVTV